MQGPKGALPMGQSKPVAKAQPPATAQTLQQALQGLTQAKEPYKETSISAENPEKPNCRPDASPKGQGTGAAGLIPSQAAILNARAGLLPAPRTLVTSCTQLVTIIDDYKLQECAV